MTNKKEHINPLFDSSGCLSELALSKYLKNDLKDAEKILIENHIKECELCADAIDGLAYTTDHDSFFSDISQIDNQIQKKAESKSPHKKRYLAYVSMAAAIALLVGLFFVFNNYSHDDILVAENEKVNEDETQKEDSPAPLKQEEILEANEEQTIIEEVAEERDDKTSKGKIESQTKHEIIPKIEELEIINNDEEITEDFVEIIPVESEEIEKELEMDRLISEFELLEDEEEVDLDEVMEKPGGGISSDKSNMPSRTNKKSSRFKRAANEGTLKSLEPLSESDDIDPSEKTKDELSGYGEIQDEFFSSTEQAPRFSYEDYGSFEEWVLYQLDSSSERESIKTGGEIIVEFTVTKKGKVNNILILKGIQTETDSLIIEIIEKSPDWIPGEKEGKNTDVKMEIPINVTPVTN